MEPFNLPFLLLTLILLKIWIDLMRNEAVFFPLPKNTIRKLLKAVDLKKKERLIDLGSGDGRVLIIAAEEFSATAIGIEKNPLLYLISRFNIKRKGLDGLIKVIYGNFFNYTIKDADVVFLYLSKKINKKLEPKLVKELKKGTRIVSAAHQLPSLEYVKKIKTGHFFSYIYVL